MRRTVALLVFCTAVTIAANSQVSTTLSAVDNISLTSLTLEPVYVKGGRLSAATLTLDTPAPPGGMSVDLSSDHQDVGHPPLFVFVPGGETAASFVVRTVPVKDETTITITATAGWSQVSGILTVGTTMTHDGVFLSWTPSTGYGVTEQQIFRGTESGFEDYDNPLADIQDNITNSYLDTTAQSGMTYYYTMKACNAIACSIPSNEASNMDTGGSLVPRATIREERQ